MTIETLLPVLGVLIPFLVVVGGWIVNRQLGRANAAKADAEAKLAEANADKASTDVQAVILANTKSLLAEARTVQAEKDAIKDERITALISRTSRLEGRFESLRAALVAHGVWDAAALIDLREHKPDYPEPPVIPHPRAPEEEH